MGIGCAHRLLAVYHQNASAGSKPSGRSGCAPLRLWPAYHHQTAGPAAGERQPVGFGQASAAGLTVQKLLGNRVVAPARGGFQGSRAPTDFVSVLVRIACENIQGSDCG